MVAIVSGNSTGLNLTSTSHLGQRGTLGSAGQGKTDEQQFVNIATGNVVLQDKDSFMAGRGTDFALVRTYNSQAQFADENADNWLFGCYRNLQNFSGTLNTTGSAIQRIGADGSALSYLYDSASNKYLAKAGSGQFDTLSYDSGTQLWTWMDSATQNKESYQANGSKWQMVSTTDHNGQSSLYAYTNGLLDSVTNPNGEKTVFTRVGGMIVQEAIRRADGADISNTYYSYDAQNRLSRVTLDLSPGDASTVDGNVYLTSYTYQGTSNLIAQITQSDGSQQNFTYINLGGVDRVASMTDALGRVTRFNYDLAAKTTTVTDPLGNVNTYTYDANNRFTQISGPIANGQVQTVQYQYDVAGNLAKTIDAQGNTISYTYDSNGNQLSQVNSLGQTVANTYDAAHHLLTSTVYRTAAVAGVSAAAAPETTRYIYDANGNVRFVLSQEGRVTENRYNAYGQKIATIAYPAATYDVSIFAASQAPALSSVTSWATSQAGANTSRVDYQYNVRGQISAVISYASMNTDGTGLVSTQSKTQYSYDINGRLLQKIVSSQRHHLANTVKAG